MTIRLTYAELEAMGPCSPSERKALWGGRKYLTPELAFAAGASLNDLLWVAGKLGLKVQLADFASRCAAEVSHLISGSSGSHAGHSARYSADAARYSADAARYSVYAKDYAKAYAARYSADAMALARASAAGHAAGHAAYDAAYDAASEKQKAIFLEVFA